MQRRGAKGEAVKIYCEPFATKAMRCYGLAFGEESQTLSLIIYLYKLYVFFAPDILF